MPKRSASAPSSQNFASDNSEGSHFIPPSLSRPRLLPQKATAHQKTNSQSASKGRHNSIMLHAAIFACGEVAWAAPQTLLCASLTALRKLDSLAQDWPKSMQTYKSGIAILLHKGNTNTPRHSPLCFCSPSDSSQRWRELITTVTANATKAVTINSDRAMIAAFNACALARRYHSAVRRYIISLNRNINGIAQAANSREFR